MRINLNEEQSSMLELVQDHLTDFERTDNTNDLESAYYRLKDLVVDLGLVITD